MDCPWAVLPHHSGLRSSGGTRKAPAAFAAPSLVANSTGLQLSLEPSSAAGSCQPLESRLCFCSPSELPHLLCSGLFLFLELLVQCLGPDPCTGMCQEHHLQMWGSLNEPRAAWSLLCTCKIIFRCGIYPQHDPVWESCL